MKSSASTSQLPFYLRRPCCPLSERVQIHRWSSSPAVLVAGDELSGEVTAVSKFGVEGLTQAWADELEAECIRVNAVNPGGTRTQMRAAGYPQEDPLTLPTPEEIAPVFVWLARADTAVTGQSLEARDWVGRDPAI